MQSEYSAGHFINLAGGFGNSLLGDKMYFIERMSTDVLSRNVAGFVAEAGVFKGGCARVLATIFADRAVYLLDSFEGMVENDTEQCQFSKGSFSNVTLEEVQNYLHDKTNCVFVKGWFPNSAKSIENHVFCFVHIDMDYYKSTADAIQFFWPRLNKGGIIVFDDYNGDCCPGVRKSIGEYFSERNDFEVIDPVGHELSFSIAYKKTT